MANYGFLRSKKSSSNTQKALKRIRRISLKKLCVAYIEETHEKRFLVHSSNTSRDTKLSIFWLILVQHENLLDP